jgi:hypothetical protein
MMNLQPCASADTADSAHSDLLGLHQRGHLLKRLGTDDDAIVIGKNQTPQSDSPESQSSGVGVGN